MTGGLTHANSRHETQFPRPGELATQAHELGRGATSVRTTALKLHDDGQQAPPLLEPSGGLVLTNAPTLADVLIQFREGAATTLGDDRIGHHGTKGMAAGMKRFPPSSNARRHCAMGSGHTIIMAVATLPSSGPTNYGEPAAPDRSCYWARWSAISMRGEVFGRQGVGACRA